MSDDNLIITTDTTKSIIQEQSEVKDISDDSNINDKLAERKQLLDEARFRLEEKKAMHDMALELQRENFSEYQVKLDNDILTEQNENHWIKTFWRPLVAMSYIIICIFDFLIFPAIQIILPIIYHIFGLQMVYTPWVPLTLSQNGLFHAAMGGIIGVSAWSRGQEKLEQIKNPLR